MMDRSNEYIIGTAQGVRKTPYEPRRRPIEEQWSIESLRSMRGTPWTPVPGSENDAVPTSVSGNGEMDVDRIAPLCQETILEDPNAAIEVSGSEPKKQKYHVRKETVK